MSLVACVGWKDAITPILPARAMSSFVCRRSSALGQAIDSTKAHLNTHHDLCMLNTKSLLRCRGAGSECLLIRIEDDGVCSIPDAVTGNLEALSGTTMSELHTRKKSFSA